LSSAASKEPEVSETNTKRSRADETRAALVDALIDLLGERSVAAISVRDVAAAAGVNHGLVHRYFGSKDALVRAAVERISDQVYAGFPARGQTAWFYRMLRANPHIAVIVARACLDGPHDLLEAAAPPPAVMQQLIARLRTSLARLPLAGAIDPNLLNAFFTSAMLGWFAFRPLFAAGYGVPADADDQLEAIIARLDGLLDAAAPA
jgi:AcrR family transcriptional regulator